MTRIGIDHRLTYYRTGGISTYVAELTRALAALQAPESFLVFASWKDRAFQPPAGFRGARLLTPCHHRLERAALSVELTRFRLDVLHSPDFIPPRSGARRRVITVHDLTFLHYPQYLTADSRRYYNDQIETAVREADCILTDSHSSKQDMIDLLGVEAGRIVVHRLGVTSHFRVPDEAAIAHWREALDLPPRYWLFVGTFEPRKNILGLLDAYQSLRDVMPQRPALLIAGTRGWLYDETLAHIQELGIASDVRLMEAVPYDALPVLYHDALAIVSPSFYEGFGLPALEGMACGTVPIVSNRSSLPEVVGDVGLQVEPEDTAAIARAMQTAAEDDAWRSAQIAAGIARAATFRWHDTARVALDAYRAVL